MKVFAIIITYNGMQWYDRCFTSLKQSEMPLQIVAVDNASTDGTADYIKANYPDVTLLEPKENLGFAKGNNLGIKYALDNDADYVFLLNQDAWLNETGTVSKLIEIAKQNKDFAILSPLQLYGNGSRIEHETVMHFARNAKTSNDLISDLYFKRVKDVYQVPFACAVSWLLPANTIKMIGGFDPMFYHYGEDDNYIQRVKYFSYKVGICPKVSISHDIESRTNQYRDEHLDWKKYQLIHLADINKNINVKGLIKIKLKVLILQTIRFNRKLFKKSYPEYKYLRKIRKDLEFSRSQNKIQQANWLS
ncbi:MAG: glycosyltransferase family 2 protein [Bacteroidales bacterium]|nr:glycosyltransferase family 2 protein [Bacteroidales bacterium]